MSVEETIFNYLKTKEDVTDIIGTGDDIRIYPGKAPANIESPYIVYVVLDKTYSYTYTGRDKLETAVIQMTLHGKQYFNGVKKLLDKVIESLDDIEGFEGIQGAFHQNNNFVIQDDNKNYIMPLVYEIWKTEQEE